MPLDESIQAGQSGHPAAHDALHALYNLYEGTEPADFDDAGAAAAAQSAAEATAAAALTTHTADTTSVHGIANTALLETTSGAQAKADAAQAAAIAASQPLDATLTSVAATPAEPYGIALLEIEDSEELQTVVGVTGLKRIKTVADATYDLTVTDLNYLIRCTFEGAMTVTIDDQVAEAWSQGWSARFLAEGAATVITFVPANSTQFAQSSTITAQQGSVVEAVNLDGADLWVLLGSQNLAPAIVINGSTATETDGAIVGTTSATSGNVTIGGSAAAETDYAHAGTYAGALLQRGPDGTHVPTSAEAHRASLGLTPQQYYERAADFTILATDAPSLINTRLAACSGGEVIQVNARSYTGSTFNITGGKSTYTAPVLIRPPVGQRQSVIWNSEIWIGSPNVIVAGFHFNNVSVRLQGSDLTGSSYWRCTLLNCYQTMVPNATSAFTSVSPELCECVNYGSREGDRVRIQLLNQGAMTGGKIRGCWFETCWDDDENSNGVFDASPSENDHVDTIQWVPDTGGAICDDFLIEDSVIWAAYNAAIFWGAAASGRTGDLTIRNCWVGSAEATSGILPTSPPGGKAFLPMSTSQLNGSLIVGYNVPAATVTLEDSDFQGATGDASPDGPYTITATNCRFNRINSVGVLATLSGSGNTNGVANAVMVPPQSSQLSDEYLDSIWGT